MLGRGLDQILPHPADPRLHEPFVRSAAECVRLAEAVNGPIPRAVAFNYVWGDMLPELAHAKPHARIINLEDGVLLEILEAGPTAAEVLEAFTWAKADDQIGTELERGPRGAVTRVYDILKMDEPEPDERR